MGLIFLIVACVVVMVFGVRAGFAGRRTMALGTSLLAVTLALLAYSSAVAGPGVVQGGIQLLAKNPAPVLVDGSVLEYADPANGGLAVSIVGGSVYSDGGGAMPVSQGPPGDAGAAWFTQLTDGGGGVISPATAGNQSTQIIEETSSASSLAIISDAVVPNASAFNPASYLFQVGAWSQSTGEIVPLLIDSSGALLANPSSVVPVRTTSLVAEFVIKAASGTHISTLAQVDATAPTDIYYVQLLQGSATCPADGAVTTLHIPLTVNHVLGYANQVVFNDTGAHAVFTTGLCVALSSTQTLKTTTGLTYLFADSSVL